MHVARSADNIAYDFCMSKSRNFEKISGIARLSIYVHKNFSNFPHAKIYSQFLRDKGDYDGAIFIFLKIPGKPTKKGIKSSTIQSTSKIKKIYTIQELLKVFLPKKFANILRVRL